MKDEDKDNSVYFHHILDAIDRIENFTEDGRDTFFESVMEQNAVLWEVSLIGEATRNVSQWLKDAHSEIEWSQIIGMRNRLVHEYFNVDLELVWDVVENDLPRFKAQAQIILDELLQSG